MSNINDRREGGNTDNVEAGNQQSTTTQASEVSNDNPTRKVAVKTLRKGATTQAKEDFLKEAKSMANFEHKNIVELIGICLDNDPNFLILELMEGGDLLTYLRNCRPTSVRQCSPLSLGDLVDMCLDVARGCAYLESIHFVHRDIAARNCLITPGNEVQEGRQTSSRRKVKIGDFGLSRDIYKTDYYRVGGEVDKLLPVKWMAPESLSDGIFTSQSDVWAFGVLLWEIWTLGQQPYSAKTNHEVMVYVKDRNTLDRPSMCPISVHSLMARCWEFEPDQRPTFAECLTQIQELQVYKDELNDICWHNSLSYVGSSGCSDRSSIASHHHFHSAPHQQNTTTTGTFISSSTGQPSNQRSNLQNGFVPIRNGNIELRRGRMDMNSRNMNNGLETTTGSIDSWKTGGGNGDSGYTNRTSTTLPLNTNSINSSRLSSDFPTIAFPSINNGTRNDLNTIHNANSSSSYVMPMPPGTHSQIGDVIKSHHVLSPSDRNNICR
jgi:proto-oncogene tyrosine-protein kinase ROS